MFNLVRCCLLLCFFLSSSVGAIEPTQEAQVLHIAREVVWTQFGLKKSKQLSSVAKQHVRDISERLAVDTVSEDAFEQALAEAEEQGRERSELWSKVTKKVGKGILICLALILVSIVIRKIGEVVAGKKDEGKADLKFRVNDMLRSAPYVLAIPVRSESDAKRVGRVFVEERLAARVDVFAHHFLTQDEEVVLVVNTVKGRLKTLQKRMVDLSLSESYLSLSVLSGSEAHLKWIADVADGRG